METPTVTELRFYLGEKFIGDCVNFEGYNIVQFLGLSEDETGLYARFKVIKDAEKSIKLWQK